MSAPGIDPTVSTIEELREQINSLMARLEKIVPAPVSAPEPASGITPEILLVISAAVAAFLGERGHINAIRLVGSARWAQQGRVNIQASHHLDRT